LPAPRSALEALRVAPEYVEFQRARQFTLVADQLAAAASRSVSVGLVAPRSLVDTFDASGPGFMASASSVGAGQFSLGAFGLTALQTHFNGTPLTGSLETLNPIVFLNQSINGPPIVAATLAYDIGLRQTVAAVTATYGVRDDLDVSLVLPIVHTDLTLGVNADLVAQLEGNADFTRLHLPRVHGGTHLTATGVGDLSLRVKWIAPLQPVQLALLTAVQFPSGDPLKLTGTGDYWVSMGLALGYPFWGGRLNALVNLGGDFDVGNASASQLTYSVGVAGWVIPRRLNLGVVFLGQSEVDDQLHPGQTGVLTLGPHDTLQTLPALGVDFGRQDTFSIALSARVVLGFGLLAFVGAAFPIGDAGFQISVATPVVGIGGVW